MIVSTVFGPCPASSVVTLQWYHLSCEDSKTVETDMRSWFSIPSVLWMTGGFRDSWLDPLLSRAVWGKCKVNCSQEELGRVAAPGPAWYGPVPAWSRSDGPGAAPLSCWYDRGMNEQTGIFCMESQACIWKMQGCENRDIKGSVDLIRMQELSITLSGEDSVFCTVWATRFIGWLKSWLRCEQNQGAWPRFWTDL